MSMNHIEFFGNNTLVGYSYYYFLQSIPFEAKKDLSFKIQSKGGIVTFSITDSSVIVINSLSDIKALQFLPFEKRLGNYFVYYNSHSEAIKQIESDEPPVKCIVLQDLIEAIEAMSTVNSIELHYQNGLPRGADIGGLISIVMLKGNSKRFFYYQFGKMERIKNSGLMAYEIPEYFRDAPDGFSLFCSLLERSEIEKHLKKNTKKKALKEEEKVSLALPEPRKENSFCQICKRKYSNFYDHLNSATHKNNQKDHQCIYQRIEKSFDRIRAYKKELANNPIGLNNRKKAAGKIDENTNLNTNSQLASTISVNPLLLGVTTNNPNDGLSNNNSTSTMTTMIMFQEQKQTIDYQSIEKLIDSKILNEVNESLMNWNVKRKYQHWKPLENKEAPQKSKCSSKWYEPRLMQKIHKCLWKIQKQIKINQ